MNVLEISIIDPEEWYENTVEILFLGLQLYNNYQDVVMIAEQINSLGKSPMTAVLRKRVCASLRECRNDRREALKNISKYMKSKKILN